MIVTKVMQWSECMNLIVNDCLNLIVSGYFCLVWCLSMGAIRWKALQGNSFPLGTALHWVSPFCNNLVPKQQTADTRDNSSVPVYNPVTKMPNSLDETQHYNCHRFPPKACPYGRVNKSYKLVYLSQYCEVVLHRSQCIHLCAISDQNDLV